MAKDRQDTVGSMDRKITIEKYTSTRGDNGEELLSWSTLATVWANVKYKTGGSGEGLEAQRETSVNKVVFLVRYRKDLTPKVNAKMRVVYEDENYDILNIQEKPELGRHSYQNLICEVKEAT